MTKRNVIIELRLIYTLKICIIFSMSVSFNLLKAQEVNRDDAILFEISGNELHTPSYLLGTWHNIEGTFAHKIQGFDSIFNKVEIVAVECDVDSMQQLESVKEWLEMEKQAKSLHIDSTLYEKELASYVQTIDTVLAKCGYAEGFKSRHPYRNQRILEWYATIYSVNESSFKSGKITTEQVLLDQYLTRLAKKKGKCIVALDSTEMRIHTGEEGLKKIKSKLYDEPIGKQITDLYYTAQRIHKARELNIRAALAYKSGQGKLSVKKLYTRRLGFDTNNVCDRNARWMRMIPDIITTKPALIAVGIGHLFPRSFRDGKTCNGLIEDLRERGYSVKAIK